MQAENLANEVRDAGKARRNAETGMLNYREHLFSIAAPLTEGLHCRTRTIKFSRHKKRSRSNSYRKKMLLLRLSQTDERPPATVSMATTNHSLIT